MMQDRFPFTAGSTLVDDPDERVFRLNRYDREGTLIGCWGYGDVDAVVVEVEPADRCPVPVIQVTFLPGRVRAPLVEDGLIYHDVIGNRAQPLFDQGVGPALEVRGNRAALFAIELLIAQRRIPVADEKDVRAVRRERGFKDEVGPQHGDRGRQGEYLHVTGGDERLIRVLLEDGRARGEVDDAHSDGRLRMWNSR